MIKIQAYQRNGVKTKECVEEFEFCCWQSLYDWLEKFQLHKCYKCKREGSNKIIRSQNP